jgi:hypothetical protein
MGFPPRLKAGRLYEDTYGNVVGPLIEIEGPTYKFTAPGECRSWTNRGSYLGGTRHGYDLIMEVKK